nr:sensor histidine kinase [Lysobacter sp. GX 14042]
MRLRLLLTIGLALAVLWGGAAVWMFRDLDRNLQHTLDERLAMSARMVAGLLTQSGQGSASMVSAEGALSVPGAQGMACQVRSLRGEVIATTREADRAPLDMSAPGYRTTLIDGHPWRTYTLRTDSFDITTADRLDERSLLRRRIALAAGVPFLIAALGGLIALWFGTGRALAPLAGLRRRLAQRPADATDPVDGSQLPAELRPLIDALNGLLERMRQAIQRERSFTNDAAHELRTPLTVIDTHLQVAGLTDGAEARQALQDASTGVERMRGTLEQLLMLARIEGRQSFGEGMHISAGEAVSRAITVAGDDAAERTRVTIEGNDPGPVLDVPPQLAVVALRNLIVNALRYSPASSRVDVEVRQPAPAQVRFIVSDHGNGMDGDEIQAATRRFWRGTQPQPGSGLGLTLVEAIAERFGGSLLLSPRQPQGLVVELTLQVRP